MCKLTVNVDKDKKEAVRAVLRKRGYSFEDAIDMYLDAILSDNDIPDKIGLDSLGPVYGTVAEMRAALGV